MYFVTQVPVAKNFLGMTLTISKYLVEIGSEMVKSLLYGWTYRYLVNYKMIFMNEVKNNDHNYNNNDAGKWDS